MSIISGSDWTTKYSPIDGDRRRAFLAIALIAAIIAFAISVPIEPTAWRRAIDDLAQGFAAATVLVATWRARRGAAGRSRTGWALLGSGVLLWFVGQFYWIFIEVVVGRTITTPSVADIGFIAAIPLEAMGLLLISFPSSRPIERLRSVLDGILIVMSLWLAAYLLVLKHLIDHSHTSKIATGVSLIYPLGDVVLITILLLALSQAGPQLRRVLILISLAYASLAISDCYFAVMTVSGRYQTGRLFDMGWTVGWLILAAAVGIEPNGEDQEVVESRGQAAVPYLMLLATVVVTVAYFALGGRTDATIRWTGISIIAVTMMGLLVQRERGRQTEIWRDHVASHDALTGLPNYVAMTNVITDLLAEPMTFGLLYCDVDRLDAVNSSLGRPAGDRLLQDIATRLTSALPWGCHVARCSGDEFAVVCEGATDGLLMSLATQVVEAFEAPFQVDGYEHNVGLTIGVVSRGSYQHADQFLRDGHHAMSGAKVTGRGAIARFNPARHYEWTIDDLELEDDLRSAIRSGEGLFPEFQPIVRLNDRHVVGYEALVRWSHPHRGRLNPGDFIGLAERTGLITSLGWWMLDAVCTTFAASRSEGWVAVNVAGAQLGRGELVPSVVRALEVSGLRASQLHLEITESQLVDPTPEILAELAAIHTLGVPVALDDFGTGYSSVALLRDLNIHTIKIDMSFTSQIETKPRSAAIVRGLIAFCDQLGIDVVAEGVETTAQETLLLDYRCPHGQGYLYGRPHVLESVHDNAESLSELRR